MNAPRGEWQPGARQWLTDHITDLDPAATSEVTNFDAEGSMKASGGSTPLTTGADLLEKGLPVEINDQPGAAVIVCQMSKHRKRKTREEPHE